MKRGKTGNIPFIRATMACAGLVDVDQAPSTWQCVQVTPSDAV